MRVENLLLFVPGQLFDCEDVVREVVLELLFVLARAEGQGFGAARERCFELFCGGVVLAELGEVLADQFVGFDVFVVEFNSFQCVFERQIELL